MNLSEYEINSINKLGKSVLDGKWSNDGLVQLIAVTGGLLNLQTIPDYQKRTGMSYNGVKNHRHTETIFGVKFVIDNE